MEAVYLISSYYGVRKKRDKQEKKVSKKKNNIRMSKDKNRESKDEEMNRSGELGWYNV